MTAPVANTRTLDAGRWATLTLAGLVATAAACVPPLPGSPYESPDDTAGVAGSAGRTGAAGTGGTTGPTGSAGVAGTAGAAGSVACGLPLTMNITPAITPPLTAGASFTFDVFVASLDAPGCPPRAPKVVCPSPSTQLQFQYDPTRWFTVPLLSGQPEDALLQVTSSLGTPTGSYSFTCFDGSGSPQASAMATYVVGTGAATAAACHGVPPPTAAIFGGIPSYPYTFAGIGVIPPAVMPLGVSGEAFHVTAAPGATTDPSQAWAGFGFAFVGPPCIDASTFSGVEFTIGGDLGTCGLQFSVLTSEDNSVANGPYGTCTVEGCRPPASGPLSIGKTTVSFAEMSGGIPMSEVDPTALNGIQWTLLLPTDGATAPCVANLTISDVSFVP